MYTLVLILVAFTVGYICGAQVHYKDLQLAREANRSYHKDYMDLLKALERQGKNERI